MAGVHMLGAVSHGGDSIQRFYLECFSGEELHLCLQKGGEGRVYDKYEGHLGLDSQVEDAFLER